MVNEGAGGGNIILKCWFREEGKTAHEGESNTVGERKTKVRGDVHEGESNMEHGGREVWQG